MRFVLLLLLVACAPAGTSVYDVAGERVGRVEVKDDDHANVFDLSGNGVGNIEGSDVFRSGSRIGRVADDDRILNLADTRIGRITSETLCLNAAGERVGRIASDIDDEAAGGACLLLLLLP